MQTLFKVVLPLSKPMLVTVLMFYLIWYWDLFQGVMIYISDTSKYNLVVLVQQLISKNDIAEKAVRRSSMDVQISPEMIKAAGIMVMVLPIIAIYPFLQKYFVKGVMIGSVKG
jgi:putative aldouronate transport system permease protein